MKKIQLTKRETQIGNGVSPSPESKTQEKKMKRQKLWVVGLFAALMLVLAPFNSTLAQTHEPENPEYYFHIVVHWSPHPFWMTFANGAMDAAKRYNVKVVNEQFPKESLEDQANRIDQVVALKPDGLVTAITNLALIEGPTMRAIKQGIPVIVANAPDRRPVGERIPYLGFVGQDERLAGQTVAREMLKARSGLKHVLIANHKPGLSVLETRAAGVRDVLEPLGVKVSVLAITRDPTQIAERYRAFFTLNPETDGFVTLSANPFNQIARKYFKEQGILDKVVNVTFDLSEDTLEATRKGEMLGMIDQQIYLEGYLAVEWLYLHKKYGFVPGGDILTGPFFVNKDNVDTVEAGIKGGWRF